MTTFAFLIGVLTAVVSLFGLIVVTRHYLFYKGDTELSANLKRVFMSDMAVYGITFLFGIWALLEWSFGTALALHVMRIPILLFNIYAAIKLYTYYKSL